MRVACVRRRCVRELDSGNAVQHEKARTTCLFLRDIYTVRLLHQKKTCIIEQSNYTSANKVDHHPQEQTIGRTWPSVAGRINHHVLSSRESRGTPKSSRVCCTNKPWLFIFLGRKPLEVQHGSCATPSLAPMVTIITAGPGEYVLRLRLPPRAKSLMF